MDTGAVGGDFSGLSGHTNELLLRHLIADRTDGRTDMLEI